MRAIIKTLKYEEVYVKDYKSMSDARRSIERFIEIVNNKRLDSALGYISHAEFEVAQLEQPTCAQPSLTLCLT